MKKLRKFPDWPLADVEEVARMLYAVAPFDVNAREKIRWHSLARKAFDFLDNLHGACEEIREQRRIQGKAYARANARLTEAQKLPDIMPFEKAVLRITGQKWIGRALPNFEKFLHYNARRETAPIMRTPSNMEAIISPKLPAKKKRQLDTQINTWRENGIPRAEVMQLQSLFESEQPLVIAELNRAKVKKRAKRSDKRRGAKHPDAERRLQPALSELAELGKKVDLS
jgi:hypothetical protein